MRTDADDKVSVPVNAGVGIVIPMERILETLDQEELVEQRRENAERLVQDEPEIVEGPAVLDRAMDDEALTRETFFESLERVSEPNEPQPDEASE